MLKGTLLAESLRIGACLDVAGLRVTRLSRRDVSASASAAQPSVWTFLDFEADDDLAGPLAQSLADALLADGGWYADLTVADDHVVVFAGKIFRYRRGDQTGRAAAVDYGRTAGVPDHQLDWTD
jgi:hypothetical protein